MDSNCSDRTVVVTHGSWKHSKTLGDRLLQFVSKIVPLLGIITQPDINTQTSYYSIFYDIRMRFLSFLQYKSNPVIFVGTSMGTLLVLVSHNVNKYWPKKVVAHS